MKEFSVIGDELKELTFEDAAKITRACEKQWFDLYKHAGTKWTPTREMVEKQIRREYANLDDLDDKVRRMCWVIGIEAVAILIMLVLHLCR